MRIRHVAILCLLSACGGGGAAIKTASQPKPPAWMTKATGTADSLFFTGAKEGASSLEDGKTSALEAARSQAAQYIGVTISAEHTDVMSTVEADNHARDQVNSRAQAFRPVEAGCSRDSSLKIKRGRWLPRRFVTHASRDANQRRV